MNLLHRDQQGFTLIELLVAIPIAALIATAAAGGVFQILNSTRASDDILAYRWVQTAGFWVSQDGIQAQSIPPEGDMPFPFTLSWTDWDDGDVHQVTYSLVSMPSGTLQRLQRQESIDGNLTYTTVGQYIDPSQTNCKRDGNVLTFNVTAAVGRQTATRTYEITPRSLS